MAKNTEKEVVETPVDKSEPELVTVPKGVLEDLQAQIDSLKNPGIPRKQKEIKERTANVLMFNDKPVVSWERVKGTEDLQWKINLLDGTSASVDYRKFLDSAPRQEVVIKSQEVVEKRAVARHEGGGGIINRVNEKDEYTRELIELEVVYREFIASVVIEHGDLAGTEFKINTLYLNS